MRVHLQTPPPCSSQSRYVCRYPQHLPVRPRPPIAPLHMTSPADRAQKATLWLGTSPATKATDLLHGADECPGEAAGAGRPVGEAGGRAAIPRWPRTARSLAAGAVEHVKVAVAGPPQRVGDGFE